MSHLLQPTDWNDAWQADESTINEGGAEFLRVVTTTQLGWLDRAALKGELEDAVNSCALVANGKPWEDIRNRGWGRTPYQCGLTFYAIGLSASGTDSPLLRLRDYHRSMPCCSTTRASRVPCCASPTRGARPSSGCWRSVTSSS